MTEEEKRIEARLKSDFDYVSSLGYNVLGIFLQGSQNYCLSYFGSDIDTKAILVPSFEDFVLNRKPVSTTIILPSDEHIDLKDIRLMHDCLILLKFCSQSISISILSMKQSIVQCLTTTRKLHIITTTLPLTVLRVWFMKSIRRWNILIQL